VREVAVLQPVAVIICRQNNCFLLPLFYEPFAILNARLFALLLYVLPHQLLSRLWWSVVRCRWRPLKNSLISWVISHYQVDIDEAESTDRNDYEHLNAFFVRALRPGVRLLADDPYALLAPADGVVSQYGAIEAGRLLQAKGQDFSAVDLLGGDSELAAEFDQGEFCTVYLSPRDYHRVHMPLAGQLRRMIHIPGRLFSVQDATARAVPNLYARNERVVAIFDTPAGPLAQVLVGAIFVSSIETVWHGGVNLPGERRALWQTDYPLTGPRSVKLETGAEMGRFNMGSTVILLVAKDAVKWRESLNPGVAVKMGEALGQWHERAE